MKPNRYSQIYDYIDKHKPATIVEIGTWNGERAIEMISRAGASSPSLEYMGYDLFESGSTETDRVEFNVKRHHNMLGVLNHILDKLGMGIYMPEYTDDTVLVSRYEDGVKVELNKGDTRETLPETNCDFAFIDGGHSIETIASDYSRLKESKCIILDDYYEPDEQGRCPDITKFGCNILVDGLQRIGFLNSTLTILPVADRVKGGGLVKMVVIENG